MAHLQAGSFALDVAECDLVVLAHDLLDDIRTMANEYTFVSEAPTWVLISIDKHVRQVLRNLLDNIVRKIIEANGGTIGAELSQPVVWFFLNLPYTRAGR